METKAYLDTLNHAQRARLALSLYKRKPIRDNAVWRFFLRRLADGKSC